VKILEFITTSNIGGAENYVVNLSKKFAEKGHEIFILSSAGEKGKNSELSVFKFLQNSGAPFKIMAMGFKYNPLTILRIAYFIKKNKFDIIHTHLSKANFVGALAAKLAGIKSVSTAHGLNKKSQYKYSDYVICISNAVRENLIMQGMNGGKLGVIYSGIDTEKFNPEAEGLPKKKDDSTSGSEAGVGGKSFSVGMLARLSREKGVELLLDAAKFVLLEIPEAKFFIAGAGLLKDELIKKAKDLDIYNSVYFVGFVGSNLVSFLKELDAVVFPSLKEGLSLALLESMAMENIVIVSDVGGMPEVVADGKNGFIIKSGDINAVYKKLVFVYNNKDAVKEMAKEARKTIIEKFNIQDCADKTLDLFSRYV
jgi:glycosyltransferase involved in cell wall biosynthesis